MALQCEHSGACVYAYRHRGKRIEVCMPCLTNKFPDTIVGSEEYKAKWAPKLEGKKAETKKQKLEAKKHAK